MAHLHQPKSGLLSEGKGYCAYGELQPLAPDALGFTSKTTTQGNTKAVTLEFQGKVVSPHCFNLKFLDIQGK